MGVEGLICVVTGGSGLVGRRLVEMLVERGAKKVVSFDLRKPNKEDTPEQKKVIEYLVGSITDREVVYEGVKGADCVWHIAALVGPYFDHALYKGVNYDGTVNIIDACKFHGVKRIVMSSSPSTRFDGGDIDGMKESDMTIREPGQFLQAYAETKAMGEIALREACCDDLMTVAIAPHQVYGPGDSLFLPSLLEASRSGKLRIFGPGTIKVSFTHVDNYCHGLIIGYDALYKDSPALGKFYVVTDDGYEHFWKVINRACVEMGHEDLETKFHLPIPLLYCAAYIMSFIGYLFNIKFRLSPFSVRMMSIHRWFDISNAKTDLKYEPLFSFEEGWSSTIKWYQNHEDWWLACARGDREQFIKK